MAEEKQNTNKPVSKAKAQSKKQEMSYADTLEARAQRGKMTHQKKFVNALLKKEQMEGGTK